MTDCDVLIVGAGPTGLVLALWLTKLGVKARIVDKTAAPGTASRALAVQARTLEFYRQLDLAEAVIERAHKVPGVNLWTRGEHRARIAFEDVGRGLTRFPGLWVFPQDEHERLLIGRLSAMGVFVERERELVGFSENADRVSATLRCADGTAESCEARFLAACDGAHSLIRETLGVGFPGGDYAQIFYVADVEASGRPIDGELHIDLDEADILAVFPLRGRRRARLIGTVRDERAKQAETLLFEDVSERAITHLKVRVEATNWFSTYRVHHRVAEHFRKGRSFLLGDAAHIHSPAGGQGMNTGIGDAINLAWKLKAALDDRAPGALLDSYEIERIAFARKLVKTTDQAFALATAEGQFADLVRLWVAPAVIPGAFMFEAVRDLAFRTVSQISLNYRGGPLSEGKAGSVRGGDRLPWVAANGSDNHEALSDMRWQAHVYGEPHPALAGWRSRLPIKVFPWTPQHARAGLVRDALYLVRPDGYVGLADEAAAPDRLERYFSARGLTP